MDRIEKAINNLLSKSDKALMSRIEEIKYCVDIPETNSKGYCYCLKVDANGRLRLQDLTYIIHSGFISGYQNRYGDNLKPPTNVYHRMTA